MRAREDPPKRPFTLTRSFFAGTQRIGASWTGDNMGDWPHLQSTVPMMLANGVAGMAFCGGERETRSSAQRYLLTDQCSLEHRRRGRLLWQP